MDDTASRGMTEYQVACLFNIAYKQLATIPNAESGFKVSGIYPFNDNLFNRFCTSFNLTNLNVKGNDGTIAELHQNSSIELYQNSSTELH